MIIKEQHVCFCFIQKHKKECKKLVGEKVCNFKELQVLPNSESSDIENVVVVVLLVIDYFHIQMI